MIYVLGQTAMITGTFQDPVSKLGLTPTTLELRIIPPSGSEIDASISSFGNPSLGIYTFTQFLNAVGLWRYRWTATAPWFAAAEGSLTVVPSLFGLP